MNIGDLRYRNLVDDLLLINIEKLTDDELKELTQNIKKLKDKIAVVLVAKRLAYGEEFFKDE